ncbi:MAG: hypothetical protein ACF8OB_09975 [Phycisphaeraceae bacterium JB051]
MLLERLADAMEQLFTASYRNMFVDDFMLIELVMIFPRIEQKIQIARSEFLSMSCCDSIRLQIRLT